MARERVEHLLKAHLNQLGTISLTAVPTSTLMWAHYAESGSGFVVAYDGTSEAFNDRSLPPPLGRVRPVRYFKRLPPVSARYLHVETEALRIAPEVLLFRKLKNWEYERELRTVLPLSRADHVRGLPDGSSLYLRRAPPQAVRGVVVGPQASPALVEQLTAYVAAHSQLLRRQSIRACLQR